MKKDWHQKQKQQEQTFAKKLDIIIDKLNALWKLDEIDTADLHELDKIKLRISEIAKKYHAWK